MIVKNLPIFQCTNCTEYLLKDAILERLEKMFKKVDTTAELEVLKYAA